MGQAIWYYVGDDGKPKGPIPEAELLTLLADGTVTVDTAVWREGFEGWEPLGKVDDLRERVLRTLRGARDTATAAAAPTRRLRPRLYHPASMRAGLVMLLLGLIAAFDLFYVVILVRLMGHVRDIQAGSAPDAAALQELQDQSDSVVVVLVVAVVAAAIAFLSWFHRAHANLQAFQTRRLVYSPGWAVGGWFVPFLNFVRPYQVAREIWDVSHEGAAARGSRTGKAGTVVGLWWTMLFASSLLGRVTDRLERRAEEVDEILNVIYLDLTSSLVAIAAAVAAIVMVRGVQRAQAAAMEPDNDSE